MESDEESSMFLGQQVLEGGSGNGVGPVPPGPMVRLGQVRTSVR